MKHERLNAWEKEGRHVLSGHGILKFYFDQFYTLSLDLSPFTSLNVSLMTLRSHDSRTERVYYEGMLTMRRTKRGSIK